MFGSIFFCSSATAAALLRAFAASMRRRSFEATVSAASAEPTTSSVSEQTMTSARTLQILQCPGAVAERLLLHAHFGEHGDEQVGHRRVVLVLQMPSALHLSSRAANHKVGQREVIVGVAVAHVAAVEEQRVIEQGAVAVGH